MVHIFGTISTLASPLLTRGFPTAPSFSVAEASYSSSTPKLQNLGLRSSTDEIREASMIGVASTPLIMGDTEAVVYQLYRQSVARGVKVPERSSRIGIW